jgi:hypothetical protein
MKENMRNLALILVYFSSGIFLTSAYSQSLVQDANVSTAVDTSAENVFNETIKIISQSKKIFIITNNNQKLSVGDFVSVALNDQLAARAVVAKNHQGQTGIKILKIYSLTQWAKLRRNMDVQIIRGDDSSFGRKVEAKVEGPSKIKTEEDLFTGDVVIEDEIGEFDENKNRHIKPDNIVGIFGSFVNADEIPSRGGTVRATEFGLTWAYQFADNIFVEGIYGRALFNSYPNDGLETLVNHYIARLKYNIRGPLYTFFLPYVGYQNRSAVSPDAGKAGDSNTNPAVLREESQAVDDLQKSGPVIGITVLRRLVPGWFVRADLGTDILSAGFSIEF